MQRFAKVDRLLRDAVGHVFPAAQLWVVDRFSAVFDRAVGDCSARDLVRHRVADEAAGDDDADDAGDRGRRADARRPAAAGADGGAAARACVGAAGVEALVRARRPPTRCCATIAAEPLESPPGTRSVYSDLGFILLGATVEHALGVSLDVAFARAGGRAARRSARPIVPRDAAACAPTEGDLRGVVHDENARALGGVAGHAGLFSTARDVSRCAHSLVAAWHGVRSSTVPRLLPPARVRQLWTPSGVPGSTWCLGWDRPAAGEFVGGHALAARRRRPSRLHRLLAVDRIRRARAGSCCSSNRVHPTRANEQIKRFRPALHDAIVAALDD